MDLHNRLVPLIDGGLANSAYLLDLDDGRALAIDPSLDLRAAARRGLQIAYAAETHLHADVLSGARQLAADHDTRILASAAGKRELGYPGLADGDEADLGGLRLRALETPGHTPEHLSYLILDGDRELAVFTGGSLTGAAAHTDPVSPDRTEELARAQYRSLRRLAELPDATQVWPTHCAWSFCSTQPGAECTSTIGAEKTTNPLLAAPDENTFVTQLLASLSSYPAYLDRLAEVNRRGPDLVTTAPQLPTLGVAQVRRLLVDGAYLVDVRPVVDYAAGHIPGSMSIPLGAHFATWLGWLVPGMPIVILRNLGQDPADIVWPALSIGCTSIVGELDGGCTAWTANGGEVLATGSTALSRVDTSVVDNVRHNGEHAAAHVSNAKLIDRAAGVPTAAVALAPGQRAANATGLREQGQREQGQPDLLERRPARAPTAVPPVRLGLRANLAQFTLLVAVNALVGAMVGQERTVVPLLAEQVFAIGAFTASLTFIVVYGFTKALANLAAGALCERYGRKPVMVVGWLIGVPVPLLLIWAPSWDWVIAANVLLGVHQGLTWSTTIIMKIDLAGPTRRGLAMGLSEAAAYLAVAAMGWATGWLAVAHGLRPAPFLVGVAVAALGLGLSTVMVRETQHHARHEAAMRALSDALPDGAGRGGLTGRQVFVLTSVRERALSAASQAAMVNNLNDGVAWGLYPVLFATSGLDLGRIGILVAIYLAVWGLGQILTGWLSDRWGRKWFIVGGMLTQAGGIALVAGGTGVDVWTVAAVLSGIGTAMVYPTLIAVIGDVAHPTWRAQAVGVYRLWRDSGYAIGALIAGITADLLGLRAAIWVVAAISALSGLIVAVRMYETRYASSAADIPRTVPAT